MRTFIFIVLFTITAAAQAESKIGVVLVDKLLAELKWGVSDLVKEGSAAKLGGQLGAQYLCIGRLGRLGGIWTLNVRLVDVSTGSASSPGRKVPVPELRNEHPS